jgi:hypothetical protein
VCNIFVRIENPELIRLVGTPNILANESLERIFLTASPLTDALIIFIAARASLERFNFVA